jgi:hypothetical protein
MQQSIEHVPTSAAKITIDTYDSAERIPDAASPVIATLRQDYLLLGAAQQNNFERIKELIERYNVSPTVRDITGHMAITLTTDPLIREYLHTKMLERRARCH